MIPDQKPEPPLPTRRWLTIGEACAYYGVKSETTMRATLKRIGYEPNRMFGPNSPRVDIIEVNRRLSSPSPSNTEGSTDDA